jgi:hypothetical protein
MASQSSEVANAAQRAYMAIAVWSAGPEIRGNPYL